MSEISTLSPRLVWEFFDQICAVPHPSGYETALADHLAAAAEKYGLMCRRDHAGNLRIDRAAAPGFENAPVIIFQAHLDMVPVAENSNFDFVTTPITPFIDGDVVRARGTTLGGDDGAGVALAMALLADPDLKCGAISGLFTVSEETGLIGAAALEKSMLDGKYLINLDCGPVGEATIGCAGGARQEITMVPEFEDAPEGTALRICLTGLPGGHSGECIDKNRGNAIKSLVAFLMEHPELKVASLVSGNADNAIPHEAQAEVVCCGDLKLLRNSAALFTLLLNKEAGGGNAVLKIVENGENIRRIWSGSFQQRILAALSMAPNGVFENDENLGIVRTSSNLAAVICEDTMIRIRSSQRSLADAERENASAVLAAHFELFGGSSEISNSYPGWTPQPDCTLVRCCQELWEEKYGTPLTLRAIHAGLECGLFSGKNPDLELISLGPGAPGCHTVDEYLVIENVAVIYEFLKQIAVKCGEISATQSGAL